MPTPRILQEEGVLSIQTLMREKLTFGTPQLLNKILVCQDATFTKSLQVKLFFKKKQQSCIVLIFDTDYFILQCLVIADQIRINCCDITALEKNISNKTVHPGITCITIMQESRK